MQCHVCGKTAIIELLPGKGIKIICDCVEYRIFGESTVRDRIDGWKRVRDGIEKGDLCYAE